MQPALQPAVQSAVQGRKKIEIPRIMQLMVDSIEDAHVGTCTGLGFDSLLRMLLQWVHLPHKAQEIGCTKGVYDWRVQLVCTIGEVGVRGVCVRGSVCKR